MIITDRKVPSDFGVNFNGETISVVSKTKFLWVIIDDKLRFSFQVDYLSNKLASQSCGEFFKGCQLYCLQQLCAHLICFVLL